MANEDITIECIKRGVKKWQIAEKLGVWDSSLSRRLRNELTEDEKIEIFKIIKDLERSNKWKRF